MHKNIELEDFGSFQGQKIKLISLQNQKGTQLQCLTLGATWHSFCIADKNGRTLDTVIGPKDLKGYTSQFEATPYFFGATIGRYAGRISEGSFILDDTPYILNTSQRPHLHGGMESFAKKVWKIDEIHDGIEPQVTLSYYSPHLEGGFPGNLQVKAKYTLTETDEVKIEYSARADEDTVLNLTNHVYLNLGRESILEHQLQINADARLELDSNLLPTGKMLPIEGTPYDFRNSDLLNKLDTINGLDDVFVLNKANANLITYRAPSPGLQLDIQTNQPSAVVFAPKSINFEGELKSNVLAHTKYPAICFETQNFPDAPNHPHFPTALLKKGEVYSNTTQYAFSMMD